MKKIGLFLFAIAALAAGCASNGKTEGSQGSSETSNKTNEPVKIVAVGSTALQPLVDSAAVKFQAENPNYDISVQGGGSGTGLSQVASGSVTIGNSDVFAEEKEGIVATELVDHLVAVVGMAPVVHKEVGVTNLTQAQLIDIFTGKVTNWKEVGGADQEILVVNRASGSGTRATFEQFGLNGEVGMQSQEQDSSGTVKKIVAETPGAISYLALSYLDDSLQVLSLDGVEPSIEAIQTNDWKIWSYQHAYTKGEPTPEVQVFLDYLLSDDVQKEIVNDLGYIAITDMKVERAADGTVK
ncbi:phosphate ABC transporter substrate-binding protein [Enterococcus sp.]|uniref:phosphate ABC transporter substrate-binding protein n=1 Tax=Enterococcus sp. TaxID=35783 RepID=UPI002FCC6F26